MERTVDFYLRGMEFGQHQVHENMILFPIRSKLNPGPEYITLSDALERGSLEISEINARGSVPELKATNKGRNPVLMIDGEELKGAKQNRVLNTSIMIAPGNTIVIPVSCVEALRWQGTSLHMERSNHVMAHEIRRKKMEQVNLNLETNRSFRANQVEIWNDLAEMSFKLDVHSPTSAMGNIYDARAKDLEDYLRAFNLIPGQQGWLVFIGGKPVGLEFISRESAFERLFQKLLKSYVLEAISLKYDEPVRGEKRRKIGKVEENDWLKYGAGDTPQMDRIQAFMKAAASCQEKRYPSIGMGYACRYWGEEVVGAALEVDRCIPHLLFFAKENGNRITRMRISPVSS